MHETTHGTTIANLGFEDVVFPQPVFVGDTIHVDSEVVAARPSASRAGQGIVTFEHRGVQPARRARVPVPPGRADAVHRPVPEGGGGEHAAGSGRRGDAP